MKKNRVIVEFTPAQARRVWQAVDRWSQRLQDVDDHNGNSEHLGDIRTLDRASQAVIDALKARGLPILTDSEMLDEDPARRTS